MRISIAFFVAIQAIFSVKALPPLSELGKASEVVQLPLDLNIAPAEVTHVSSFPEAGAFSHSKTSPFKRLRMSKSFGIPYKNPLHLDVSSEAGSNSIKPNQIEQHSPFRQARQPVPLAPQALTQAATLQDRVPFPQNLDRSLQAVLKDPSVNNFLRIPNKIHYFESKWFDQYWHDVRDMHGARRTILEDKIKMNQDELDDILGGYSQPIREGLDIYRMPVLTRYSSKVEPGEVLVRAHHYTRAYKKTDYISVWSSQGQGSSLAFLGYYHAARKYTRKFLSDSGAVHYKVVNIPGRQEAYLKPVLSETAVGKGTRPSAS